MRKYTAVDTDTQNSVATALAPRRGTIFLEVHSPISPRGALCTLWLILRQFLGYGHKDFIHIHGCFSGGLHEEQTVVLGIGLRFLEVYSSFTGKVGLISRQGDYNIWACLSLKFLHPVLCSGECFCVGDVIDHNGGLGSSVVHRGQAVVPLLPCRVPNLKLDCCVIQAYCLCEESSSNGALLVFMKLALDKTQDKTRLPHRRLP